MQFKILLTSLLSGLFFGIGLILSGMTNPAKVIGFLDVFGAWDASMMFVMIGAISLSFFAFQWVRRQQRSLLNEPIKLPTNQVIDIKLVSGAAIFGIGWGLSGFCPGPAVVTLSTQIETVVIFFLAMITGIIIYKQLLK